MENPKRVVPSCVLLVLLLVLSALVLQVAADSERPTVAYALDDLSDLLAPTDLVAVGFGETHVDLSWQDNSPDETAFLIERSPDGSTAWHHVATVGPDVTNLLVSGMDCDGTYYHRVRAYRSGDGQYSAYSNVAGATTAPCRPSGLAATSLSETEIDLNWTDNSSTETEFRIERSLDASTGWTQIDTVGPNETSYHDSDLACSNLYYYRVRAHRGGDGMSSGASDQASAATTPCPPTGLQAAALCQTELRLTWQDNSDDETAFHVERSPDGLSDWTQIGLAPAGAVSYTDSSLDCNSHHYYRVRAYRSDMDVVGAAREAGEIAWWENDGAGAFSRRTVATGFGGAYSVHAADVDGDQEIDILGTAAVDYKLAWWQNDGQEHFAPYTLTSSFNGASCVFATDLNGDGHTDILGAANLADTLAWWQNDGSEVFTEHVISDTFDGANRLRPTDLDGDGDTDILASASKAHTIAWWQNDGSEQFTPITITETFSEAQPVRAVDIDGDDDLDVLGGAWLSDEISWWENDGGQSFTEHSIVTGYLGTYAAEATDLDGDGDVDVLGAAYIDDDVSWWENDGTQSFTRHVLTDTFHGATYVHAADLDGDGDVDIVASAYEDDKVVWWENRGGLSFVEHVIASDFDGAYSVYAADVDGDSRYSQYSNVAQAATDLCPTPPPTWVVDTTADGGPGSLRQALLDAVNGDVIGFDPAAFPVGTPATILLTSGPLPDVTQGNLTIDASTAGVVLDGSSLGTGHGLHLTSDGNVVHGLQILNFPEVGIAIDNAASHNTIGGINATPGGACTGECNVIGGNVAAAIQIRQTGADYNVVSGNYIGTDSSGTSALPNGDGAPGARALSIDFYASYNVIGGITPGKRNLISGNNGDAVMIVWYANHNYVLGNYIGTDVNGTAALPNTRSGISVGEWAEHNVIGGPNDSPGGPCSGACNVISGNGDAGLYVSRQYDQVIGNYIGTGVQGDVAIPNNGSGVHIFGGANHTLVGGNSAARRNLISGNNGDGVLIGDPGSAHNQISGNYIGLDVSGSNPLGNNADGVRIYNEASYNVVGGSAPGEGNVIGNHPHFGVDVNGPGTVENLVVGNHIGTNAAGTEAHPNGFCGVGIHGGAQYNTVGGDTPAERNLISGNSGEGIKLEGVGTDHNVVQGNYIGTDLDGTGVLGNGTVGVSIIVGAQHNLVGGASPGQGNLIRGNQAEGVYVHGYATLYNSLRGNRIYDNGGQGILLFEGGNGELAPPILTSVVVNAVYGIAPAGSTIDVFSDEEDEGRYYHGSATADGSGHFSYTQASPFTGTNVTATVTDLAGNTSEFSTGTDVPSLSVSPARGGNTGDVTLTISGEDLDPESEVTLTRAGEDDIVATVVLTSPSGLDLLATFNLRGKAPGLWNVVVAHPGGTSATLYDAFEIVNGGGAELVVELLGPETWRVGRETKLIALVKNEGMVNHEVALLEVSALPVQSDRSAEPGSRSQPSQPVLHYSEFVAGLAPTDWQYVVIQGVLLSPDCYAVYARPERLDIDDLIEKGECAKLTVALESAREDLEKFVMIVEHSRQELQEKEPPCPDVPLEEQDDPDCIRLLSIIRYYERKIRLYEEYVARLEAAVAECEEKQGPGANGASRYVPPSGTLLSLGHEQASLTVCGVTSWDPNDKSSTAGAGEDGYVPSTTVLPYTVFFENLAAASAPAEEVLITDQLDSDLDWYSFSLDDMQVGERPITVPHGLQNYSTTIDLRPVVSALVDVDAVFDPNSGQAEWLFRGRDPDSGALTGFLPPNTEEVAPQGEGWVSYRVLPEADLSTGTVITNQATIDFEVGIPPEPMDTPRVTNTIDADLPSSQVLPLPDTQTSPSFEVQWSGTDGTSGIGGYTVYVSDDGGPYLPWLTAVVSTSATFSGSLGHTYRFFSRARDRVGNLEELLLVPDAATSIPYRIYLPLILKEQAGKR